MNEDTNLDLTESIPSQVSPDTPLQSIQDPLTLTLDDDVFLSTLRSLEKEYDNYASDIRLDERREDNKKYLFGRQYQGKKHKDWQQEALFLDNVIYEGESYIVPMSLSNLPDITVKPGNDSDQAKQTAKILSKVVTKDIQTRERKRVLKMAFKHLPVYLVGVIKAYWDPTKGSDGDFNFKWVHPSLIRFDPKADSNDPRSMRWISEQINWTVKEWIMHFPSKKNDLIDSLYTKGVFTDKKNENNEAGLNSKIQGKEVWFTWYKDVGDSKFERQECVAWVYEDLVMGKMLSPNWDWKGQTELFDFTDNTPVTIDKMQMAVSSLLGMGVPLPFGQRKVFKNFMDYPDKPYILIGYDQWGEGPLDETSRIEQVIQLQKTYDLTGTQINSMLQRSRGKHVFSSTGGVKKSDIEELDYNDPDEDLFVTGKIADVHTFIPMQMPDPSIIQHKNDTRERIFDKMGVHGPARGQVDMGSPATNNQISREGDFTRNDDLTDDTVNYASEKMARWELQFIKLRYTKDHITTLVGEDGNELYQRLHTNMIEEGMDVEIGASGTDKLNRKQQAMDEAKMQLVDPFSFYTDVDDPDPKGRTEKLALWSDPNMRPVYLQQLGIDVAGGMTQALNGMPPQAGQPPMQQPPQQATAEPVGPTGAVPSPQNTATIAVNPPGRM